jgi:cell wall-associated NlpC family hydrolase
MPVKGGYLFLVGAGAIMAYSGVKGKGISSAFRSVLSGQSPATAASANLITNTTSGTPVSAGTSSSIANLALEYVGFRYVYGAAPDSGATDCSGFVNMIVGWFSKLPIPGYAAGTYNGSTHGPSTLSWLTWSGCKTIALLNAEPGDLAIWQSHMGIITSSGGSSQAQVMMVSDLDPSLGTQQTTVAGAAPPGEVLVVRRLTV